MANPTFSLTPTPQAGATGAAAPFGSVPGNIGNPLPQSDQQNAAAGQDILSQLGGTLSPGTLNALQNASAEFGVSSGMPGSQLSYNQLFGNIAGASEAQQQQGISNYGNLNSPQFQTGLAEQNAVNAASPNPTAAASYSEQLYSKYLAAMGGGAGHVNTANVPNGLVPGFGSGVGSGTGSAAGTSSAPNLSSTGQPVSNITDILSSLPTNPVTGQVDWNFINNSGSVGGNNGFDSSSPEMSFNPDAMAFA